jgi:hypothetical protein
MLRRQVTGFDTVGRELYAPMLNHLENLPMSQRDALGTAFGL